MLEWLRAAQGGQGGWGRPRRPPGRGRLVLSRSLYMFYSSPWSRRYWRKVQHRNGGDEHRAQRVHGRMSAFFVVRVAARAGVARRQRRTLSEATIALPRRSERPAPQERRRVYGERLANGGRDQRMPGMWLKARCSVGATDPLGRESGRLPFAGGASAPFSETCCAQARGQRRPFRQR